MFFCITPDGNGCRRVICLHGCGSSCSHEFRFYPVRQSLLMYWYIGTYIGTIIGTVTSGAKMGGGEHGVDVYGL